MIKGFDDAAKECGTYITGGQSVYNTAPMIGGAAIASGLKDDYVLPTGAEPNDVLVLTKPLGT